MPQKPSPKRKPQHAQIKKSSTQRVHKAPSAKGTAVRTVTPKRAGAVSSRTLSRASAGSATRHGSLRSRTGPSSRTYDQLYAEAQRRRIQGRSSMRKAELVKALSR